MTNIRTAYRYPEAHNPFQNLAYGVIRQAVIDYKALGRKLQKSGSEVEKKHISKEMKTISQFFLSDWYVALSGLDNGRTILKLLDKEVFGEDD